MSRETVSCRSELKNFSRTNRGGKGRPMKKETDFSKGETLECPDWQILFTSINQPDRLTADELNYCREHIKYCAVCAEDISVFKEKLEKPDPIEPSSDELDLLVQQITRKDDALSVPHWLKDLAGSYPSPGIRPFDLGKFRDWVQSRLRDKLASAVEFFDISSLSMPVLSPSVIRSAGGGYDHSAVEELTVLAARARSAVDAGEFRDAGELYHRMSGLLDDESLDLDLKFLAGIAYLRAGDARSACELLAGTIDEEASEENYWALACAHLVADDLESAYKNLQIVEKIGGELSERARILLDDIQH